jgi:hypothetical protein
MNRVMRRLLLLLLPLSFSLGCLPNPQSEWVSSEGGEQRATTDDPTILAASTFPDVDVVWDAPSGHWVHREHAHVARGSHGSHTSHHR